MKYIFLLILLCTAQVGFAQGFFDESPTDPAVWNKPAADTNTTGGGLVNTSEGNKSGGSVDTSEGNTSGGLVNTSGGNNSGGVVNTSAGNYSGGSLPELEKPNLTVVGITNWFIKVLNYIAILLFTAALVTFLYGVFVLMFVGGAKEESRSKGKKFMFWGIVSLFVMTSTWGLVNILRSSIFGNTNGQYLYMPQLK